MQAPAPELDDATIDEAVAQLQRNGYFTDESTDIGSTTMENHENYLMCRLRKRGYTGGDIFLHGDYFQGSGAIYFAFDTCQFDRDEAVTLVRSLKKED